MKKWRQCEPFKENALYGTIFTLLGCVSFWNISTHKTIREINNEYKIVTPENLKNIAWAINGLFKGIGVACYIKALSEYRKC